MSNATNHDDIDLMLYADGEVDGEISDAIAELVERDEHARLKLEALDQINETIRGHLELAADDAAPGLDAMWEAVERRIGANGVAEDAPAEQVAPARRASGERRGLWATIAQWFADYRGYVMTGALAASAAAIVVLVLRPPEQTVIVQNPVVAPDTADQNPTVNVSNTPEVKHVVDESSPPETPEIEDLEVTDGSSAVFLMPSDGDDDVSATVIFVDLNDVEPL